MSNIFSLSDEIDIDVKHLIYIHIYEEKLFTKYSISVKVKWASLGFEYGWKL
jgi:hypothetical protein